LKINFYRLQKRKNALQNFNQEKSRQQVLSRKARLNAKNKPPRSFKLASKTGRKYLQQSCQGKRQKTLICANFAIFGRGTTGPSKEPLDLVCRANRRKTGKMPSAQGLCQKVPVKGLLI